MGSATAGLKHSIPGGQNQEVLSIAFDGDFTTDFFTYVEHAFPAPAVLSQREQIHSPKGLATVWKELLGQLRKSGSQFFSFNYNGTTFQLFTGGFS